MRNIRRREFTGGLTINMTPMIDITFLLLTFFTLSSHFASAEKVELDLPRPDQNQAQERRFPDKVTINMIYNGENAPATLRMGAFDLPSPNALGEYLAPIGRYNPATQVILRADRRLPFGQVRQMMETIAGAGLSRVQVVAELGVR
ncbi:MAG TPA: biopolymer transporter ExbD [Phycisphaerae bacterium]|nr:biopolymer transporter ExbD [Phycisphaerae bacterium]HOJ75741.1 biopolymer transporter ExbD [Phycisphaerae bacterium]HOM51407.1 biopolymer transporter ExbD [Phycisphaerae bacterium]HOQ87875.1 biopolymer transporter ExbD [Phycisphaerae bacterium]HPP26935.1 biopolymer transporter ExbD [Phycisphaerae bacterium]